ncbi:MAG: mobility-associated LCxxNW protein [Lachnospiraceae bacterium]|nr:mobility-associated LCxxNW protein [Lachnospiraceae bacterium]
MINNVSHHFDPDDDFYAHIPHVRCVHGECPCSRSSLCDIWTEFQISQVSLGECNELLHGNWLEITRLRNYTDYLQKLLKNNGIDHESEFQAWDSMIEEPDPEE